MSSRLGDQTANTHNSRSQTEDLAEFIASFSFEKLSTDVRSATQSVVRDGIGVLLAAANPAFSTGRLIAEFVQSQGGTNASSVVGHGFRTSAVMAALANGTMGYACDMEPHHPQGVLHPIAVMVPTALAVGELTGATGNQFLGAVALGCEVEYRLSIALGPVGQYELGFHPSAVCGCFGAAAAASHLLGLDADACERALGLAGCQASGLMAWETDETENARPFQMGMAARNGVTAALLAQAGFGGPRGILDPHETHNIFRAFTRVSHPRRLVEGLGEDYDGVTGLAIKPYSCVSFLHPGLDALLDIVREHNITASDIDEIVLRFPRDGIDHIDANPLKSHSAQYILSVALVNRGLRVSDLFIDQRVENRQVAELCTRVRVESDPELDSLFPDLYASIVDLKTHDGRRFSRRNDTARGYPSSPMSGIELEEKFNTLVGSVASPSRIAALSRAIDALPGGENLTELAHVLRARPFDEPES